MKKIGFIGAFDKTDFIVYVAKMLTVLGNRVLMIDASLNQKAKYVVPVISPTRAYITQYEDIDVSVGFYSFEQINNYVGANNMEQNYDIVLIDVDTSQALENFNIEDSFKNFFVTSFDLFSLKKGLEAVASVARTINLTKVLFTRNYNAADDDYLNFLSMRLNIEWNQDDKIIFPFDQGDRCVIIENQRLAKIKIGNLSAQYKEGLLYIVERIAPEINPGGFKKALKSIEKGV